MNMDQKKTDRSLDIGTLQQAYADDRLPRLNLHSKRQCHRGAAPAGRRGHCHRPDQPEPVCLRVERHAVAAWGMPQCVQSWLCIRRLQCGLGGVGCAGPRQLFPGHRHDRVGPGSGWFQPPGGLEAHAGLAVRAERGARLLLAGHGVHLHVDCRGRTAGAGGGPWL